MEILFMLMILTFQLWYPPVNFVCGRRLKLLVHIQPWFCVKLGTGRQIGWLAWSFSPEGFLQDIWPGYSVHPTSTTIAIDRLVCVYSRTCTKYMRLLNTLISQFPYPRSFYCTAQLRLVLEPKETNSHILGGGGGKNTQKIPFFGALLKMRCSPHSGEVDSSQASYTICGAPSNSSTVAPHTPTISDQMVSNWQ